MEPRKSPLPVALLVVAAGGVLLPHLSESTRGLAVPVSAQIRVEPAETREAAAERGVDALDLLGDYFGVDRELDAAQRLQRVHAEAERTHTHVRFLTATVPDPVDSRAGWEFDANVDAIQQAVSDSGWLLDRFAFPDIPEPRGGASAQARLLHERWPGVVLSRDSADDERKPVCAQDPMCSELLVTFLVAETPTGGVHQAAFARAIRFVGAWSTEAQTIAVLGPTFSGSSSSLGRAIGALAAELPRGSRFRFVSGSATSRENQRVIQGAAPDVTFRATALPDDVLFPMPIQYLFSKDPDIQHHGLALLAESNTDYAHQLIHGTKSGIAATLLPFPMYVSRLRSEAASSDRQTADQPATPARFRPLSLQESATLTDLLPATAPTTTSNYAELRLANILDTVRRQDIRTIGIVATEHARQAVPRAEARARIA